MIESFDKERLPREVMLPEIKTLLDAAGLNDVDIRFFTKFSRTWLQGFCPWQFTKK
jgi:hypothetical protein